MLHNFYIGKPKRGKAKKGETKTRKPYESQEEFVKDWRSYWHCTCEGVFLNPKEKAGISILDIPYQVRGGTNHIKLRSDISTSDKPAGQYLGYLKLGERILAGYWDRHRQDPSPFSTESRKKLKLFGLDIVVVFDKIDCDADVWSITDYKTDKQAPTQQHLDRIPQFTLYSMAFRELFKAEEQAIYYEHLRSGTRIMTTRTPESYTYLESILVGKHREIENAINSGVFTSVYGHKCYWCDYSSACQRFNLEKGIPVSFELSRPRAIEVFAGNEKLQDLEKLLQDSGLED